MSTFMLEKAEKRIAELELQRDVLALRCAALEDWRDRVREAVGGDSGFCCCGMCGDNEEDE